ncbi:hypothetical protein [Paraburkholderia megapolitana]|uniref:hypothetical protein n=1 Tax=Paraburkholderia megapolitana TaxID=420953 RepID=UPI000B82FB21|nr:hypothetical protein [Paraburkholderia megapolitana]QDQ85799.1 hypothetical protein FNZ07_33020 [Paraburkholderia megapolitana]
MDLPLEIDDSETIVRGMCSPYHVSSKGKVKPEAFDPTPDTDEVSVMRHDYMGSDACRERALALEDTAKGKIYRGLAALSAGSIREAGADVVDSRHIFDGHGDIKLGFVVKPGEPLPPEELIRMRALTKALAKAAKYFPDPNPQAAQWTGQAIVYCDC